MSKRQNRWHMPQRYTYQLIGILTLILAFLLTACGPNTGTASNGNSTPSATANGGQNTVPTIAAHSTPTPTTGTQGSTPATPVSTSTPGTGSGNNQGCPANALVTTNPPSANVVLEGKDARSTMTAHVGDVIEVRLSFGRNWGGEPVPAKILQAQTPVYAWNAGKECIWLFTAKEAGTVELDFSGRPICVRGQACPMNIVLVPFTIDVKA